MTKSASRRREILESCYQVVARTGLEGATLKRIGKAMGVAPSLLMHYFHSKEELILALVDYMVQRMDRAYLQPMKRLTSARERLQFYLDKNFTFEVPESVADKVFYGCFYLAVSDGRVRDSFRRMYDHDQRIIAALVREYQAEAGIRGADPDVLAVQIISLIEGFYLYRVVYGETEELQAAVARSRQGLWREVEGQR